jgi:4-alpha-glucanotransferase
MYDAVRIDHFRGFDAYWRIPLPAANAKLGRVEAGSGLWISSGPVGRRFPAARIIAEDLGLLTPSVEGLLRDTGLPGMAVLQFAFGGDAKNAYLPHNLQAQPGRLPGHPRQRHDARLVRLGRRRRRATTCAATCGSTAEEIGWDFIRAAYSSVCRIAVVPMQDLSSASGPEARLQLARQAGGQLALAPRRGGPRAPGATGERRRVPGRARRTHRSGA